MSCGGPHELDCAEALAKLDAFLDDEVTPHDHARIAAHLQECAPCLSEYQLERIVKSLVARCCCEHAPIQLRTRVVAELVSVQYLLHPDQR
ncbi:MAG: mycothiol system anti-sigma-R factor [Candidatus Nanopelagicales bacterium]